MKKLTRTLVITGALALTGVVGLFVARAVVESASPVPDTLGVKDDRLAGCPDSPNCVSSASDSPEHYIAPLAYTSDPADARAKLIDSMATMPGMSKLISDDPAYVRAEFRSRVFGFIDDVEFYIDEGANVIQVRSAARLGHSDFGVNRSRVEQIREAFKSTN